MSENKTIPTGQSVTDFLNAIPDERKRSEGFALLDLFRRLSGEEPQMWGPSIIGFGSYHYKYESGREGDSPRTGFSPRKQNLVLYGIDSLNTHPELAAKLGKYKTGTSCLYINKLADVDLAVLEELVRLQIAA